MRYRKGLRKADMPTPKLTAEIITAAIQGFEFQKTSIDGKIAELSAMLFGGSAQTAAKCPGQAAIHHRQSDGRSRATPSEQ